MGTALGASAIAAERWLDPDEVTRLASSRGSGAAIAVSSRVAADLRMLASGAYAPLSGFMSRDDYLGVTSAMTLGSGERWTLPITLPLETGTVQGLTAGAVATLVTIDEGAVAGTIEVHEIYERDLEEEAHAVYGTADPAHPGVRLLLAESPTVVAGDVRGVRPEAAAEPSTPAESRAAFAERGWRTVVAFQTRNPVHRAHEHITKVAMEQVDGLFLHPLSGDTKGDDVPFWVRMRCYRALLEHYYPPQRVVLGLFPAAMRYAGPREAVFHGLVRRNYGCSHFIIGRDAAGVGNYYGPFDAQRLYDELGGADRLGFTAVKFGNAFYCRACESMATDRTCPHDGEQHLRLSGSRVRQMLRAGEELPHQFSRPEVAAILREAYLAQDGPS